jgi:hypothetical protein
VIGYLPEASKERRELAAVLEAGGRVTFQMAEYDWTLNGKS